MARDHNLGEQIPIHGPLPMKVSVVILGPTLDWSCNFRVGGFVDLHNLLYNTRFPFAVQTKYTQE